MTKTCNQHPMGCTCNGRLVYPPMVRGIDRIRAANDEDRCGRGVDTVASIRSGAGNCAPPCSSPAAPVVEVQVAPEPNHDPHTGLRGYVHRWFNRGSSPCP